MSSTPTKVVAANVEVQPSKYCRFCQKYVSCLGTKVPRVSLFNVVRNKQLAAFTGTESLILADVVASLGKKLLRHKKLSAVSCLTCARSLCRIYGSFVKLVSQSNDGIPFTASKRLSSNSPTGISPLAKRTRDDSTSNTVEMSRSSRRSLALGDASSAEKENVDSLACVTTLEDTMQSAMNLPSTESDESIMKVGIWTLYFRTLVKLWRCYRRIS